MPWDDDTPDEEWVDDETGDDPSEDVLECPNCGSYVHEDTQQCPFCREWITPIDRRDAGNRRIWLIAAILLIVVFSGLMFLVTQ